MLMAGGFLSIMLPSIGPAVAQFPAKSHTWCEPVIAFAVSVPTGNEVASKKLLSGGFASPETASFAPHEILASVGCHRLSGPPHCNEGAAPSILMLNPFEAS